MALEDEAFLHAPFLQNIPVLLAWIGIWYRNFWNFSSLAILPYAKELEYFPNYLQQLEMESNGKSINRTGKSINTAPCSIRYNWVQHFGKLLCQMHKIASILLPFQTNKFLKFFLDPSQ